MYFSGFQKLVDIFFGAYTCLKKEKNSLVNNYYRLTFPRPSLKHDTCKNKY